MNWHYQIIRTTPVHLFRFCWFVLSFCASCNAGITVVHHINITCIGQERDALLKFKHHIQSDYCGLMSSWGNPNTPDCCAWKGVSCSKKSGHVIGLHLPGDPYYPRRGCLDSPVISPSLGELNRLKYLDLSSNFFSDKLIPSFIGSLVNLIHLNLSHSGFSGNIPHVLGNLTRLTSLDLSYNEGLHAKSLSWLSRLTSLTDINLVDSDLSKAKDWFRIIASLPLLEVLKMDYCELHLPLPSSSSSSSSFFQSANLRVISLAGNNFSNSSSFQGLFNTINYSSFEQSLEHLDLSATSLHGPIPDAITNLQSLMCIDLSYNSLSGPIPSTLGPSGALGTMHSLSYLDLSHNRLEGSIPSAIGDSYSILQIDLSNNQLQGPIPSSLGGASSLSHLDLSNNHLEGVIPGSIANLEYLGYLDLSSNNLSGDIPCKLEIRKPPHFANFSYNNLSGSVPKYLSYPGFDPFQGNPNFHTGEVQGPCDAKDDGKSDDKIYPGMYVSIGLGIYTGFWAFCGTLTVKTSWRNAYFRFLDHIIDKIYVTVAIYLARFRRNSQV